MVRKAQTELLGITQISAAGQGAGAGVGQDRYSVMTNNIDALRLAQDIFFGEERQKI